MRKYKKSVWLPILLFIYVTAMAIYFIPRNQVASDTEKILTVAGSYLIIFLLWLSLRSQEKRREKREKDSNSDKE